MDVDEDQFLKAHVSFVQKNYMDTLLIFDKLFDKVSDPTMEMMKEYAISLQNKSRYEESIRIGKMALEKNQNDTEMLLNNCICFGKLGNYGVALKLYEKILKLDQNYKIQIGYYAYLLGKTGKSEMADFYYKQAIAYEPENMWYVSHYAFFLQQSNRYCEADKYYKIAIKNDSGNSWLHKRYAMFIYGIYGKDAAFDYYNKLIEGNPQNYNSYINAAELAIISEDWKTAFAFLRGTDSMMQPPVIKIILLFYWIIYYICNKEYGKVDEAIREISILRNGYVGYIHRDFTDLNDFINKKLNDAQKKQYINVSKILSKGRTDDAANRS